MRAHKKEAAEKGNSAAVVAIPKIILVEARKKWPIQMKYSTKKDRGGDHYGSPAHCTSSSGQ